MNMNMNDPYDHQMVEQGYIWQPWAMGGGEWKMPLVVRLAPADVELIARTVVRLLREDKP